MNRFLLIIFLLSSSLCLSQREKFNCYELTKQELITKYYQYSGKGFKLVHNGVDVLPFVIDDLSAPTLRQTCINAWSEVDQNGFKYTHGKFQRRNFEISYQEYLNDIDYLEILSYLRYEMIKNLD